MLANLSLIANMKKPKFINVPRFTDERILVAATILITLFSRLYHLEFQSLWFDELYSMIIANPENSYKTILQNIRTDFHPPFYYLSLNTLFQILPYNDFSGRLISALIGIAGVFLTYILGNAIKDKRTGIVMAFLTSIFFFHIKYSQEVRMYILIFALSTLLTTIFINIIKRPKLINFFLYFLISALSIYTHYYAFFIILAHFSCMIHLAYVKKVSKNQLKYFFSLLFLLSLAYLPWIPHLFSTGNRHHFMLKPEIWYFAEYLYEYTGKEPLTTFAILIVIFTYFSRNLKEWIRKDRTQEKDKNLTFLIIFYSLISVFIVTYLISYFKPVLNKHSTIVAIPFLIAILSLEIGKLKKTKGNIVLILLLLSNFINIAFINRYYVANSKDNFKQITASIDNSAKLSSNSIVISQMASLYNYYFRQLGSKIRVINPNEFKPEAIIGNVDNFFVMNAPFTEERGQKLEKINELGFLILYPNLEHEAKNLQKNYEKWTEYIDENFTIDSSFIDKKKNFEVAFRYRKKTLSE